MNCDPKSAPSNQHLQDSKKANGKRPCKDSILEQGLNGKEYLKDSNLKQRLNDLSLRLHVVSNGTNDVGIGWHTSESEGRGTKKSKTEDSVTIDNFQEFNEKTIRLVDEDKSIIQGLKPKIHALLNFECESNKFCFLQWLKEFDGCDNDKRTLNMLKNRALNEGNNLSRHLVDLMLLMSYDEMLKRIQVLETSLEWVLKGESSVVIHRILEILERLKLRNKKQSEMVDNLSAGERVIVMEEIDDIIFRLLKEVFRLELIWMHKGLADSKDSVMDGVESLIDDMDECERVLVGIALEILDVLNLFASGQCADQFEAVDAMWKDVKDYCKDKGQKRY